MENQRLIKKILDETEEDNFNLKRKKKKSNVNKKAGIDTKNNEGNDKDIQLTKGKYWEKEFIKRH